MNFIANTLINTLSIIFCLIILSVTYSSKNRKFKSYRIFNWLIFVTIALALSDTLARTEHGSVVDILFLNQLGNFLLFSINPLVPTLWVLYVVYLTLGKSKTYVRLAHFSIIYLILNFGLVIANLFLNFLYTIDDANIYTRGPLFFLPFAIYYLPVIMSFIYLYIRRKDINKKNDV